MIKLAIIGEENAGKTYFMYYLLRRLKETYKKDINLLYSDFLPYDNKNLEPSLDHILEEYKKNKTLNTLRDFRVILNIENKNIGLISQGDYNKKSGSIKDGNLTVKRNLELFSQKTNIGAHPDKKDQNVPFCDYIIFCTRPNFEKYHDDTYEVTIEKQQSQDKREAEYQRVYDEIMQKINLKG